MRTSAVAGIVFWYYFDNNFKEYREIGQINAASYEKIEYFSKASLLYSLIICLTNKINMTIK